VAQGQIIIGDGIFDQLSGAVADRTFTLAQCTHCR